MITVVGRYANELDSTMAQLGLIVAERFIDDSVAGATTEYAMAYCLEQGGGLVGGRLVDGVWTYNLGRTACGAKHRSCRDCRERPQ